MAIANIFLTCSLMFVGPLLSGSIPLAFQVSETWVKWMDLLGAGVMISSAFAVVLPEGFDALYEAARHNNSEEAEVFENLLPNEHHREHARVPQGLAGIAVLSGFLAMMIFEFWHDHLDHHPQSQGSKVRSQLFECSNKASHGGHKHSSSGCSSSGSERSVLTAMVIHAAADGLAVGVAHMSDSLRLAVAIGAAMVLHKGPVAFGLSTYLVSLKCSMQTVMLDMFLFSATSPVVAILSFAAMRAAGGSSGQFVAACVLFSAGTFLYAACVHMLPNLSGKEHSWWSIAVLLLGAAIPCGINSLDLHGHAH